MAGYDDLLAPAPAWQRWARMLALPASVGIHLLFALYLATRPPPAHAEVTWVEMAVVEPPAPDPPAEPEPEPEPEPESEPELDAVAFEDALPEAELEARPEPEPERVVRRIQGLSASSFATGSGTGVAVRRGTTTGTAAGDETMDLGDDDPFVLVPVASVTTQPKNCTRPPVEVPKEAIEAEYEGTIRMVLDLDERGRVFRVAFQDRAEHGVEEACQAAALRMRCKPARKDGVPVSITGMPHRCTIKAID